MQRNAMAVVAAAISLAIGPAVADSALAELDASWSGSEGTGIFLGFTGSGLTVDGMDFHTHGTECECFAIPLFAASGENPSTGRSWSTSWDGRFYAINGHEISFGGGNTAEFVIPAGGTLDITVQFQSLQGDNSFSFTNPDAVTTVLTSRGTVNYSFTNTTGDWAFEWTAMSLTMIGTVPEPSQGLLMVAGVVLLGRRFGPNWARRPAKFRTCDGNREAP